LEDPGSIMDRMIPRRDFLAAGLAGALTSARGQTSDELNFLSHHTDFQNLREMLATHVKSRAMELLDQRREAIARISSAEGVTARRQLLRERMQQALGGAFPERTPLNPRITGTIDHDEYKIEKIVFESQPKFYVTANLYLPKRGSAPYPAILFPLGHEAGAKSHSAWQQVLVSFARRGYVALAWDPIGQGERVQLYDEDFKASKVVRSTTEHTILGFQCLLTGDNLARYTIWDGMRALDYLLSRPEVDSKRVGVTGNSGGGTHTAYLAALDDRIQVAAPSCYITSWKRLLESIGPQDAEQCLPPWIADGLDHADFIYAFAPKPYMILSAIRDFFSISGARESYREAQRIYDLTGAAEKIGMTEADDGHGYTKPRRLAAYRWFGRWLKGEEDNSPEADVALETEEAMQATPTGQVATSLGGETVWSLNKRRAEQIQRKQPAAGDVRRVTAFQQGSGAPAVRGFGVLDRAGYRIEKLLYDSEPGIQIPALLYVPASPGGRMPAVILVNGRGKAAANEDAAGLAKSGRVVLSIDARGFGETRRTADGNGSDWPRYFGDFESAMTALLTGRNLVGMRARDISRGVDLLAGRSEVDASRIRALGQDAGGIPALHAAVLDPRIAGVALEGMLISYRAVVEQRIHRGIAEQVIPGILKTYDLPDLAKLAAPRPVWIVDAMDPVGQLLPLERVRAEYPHAVRVLRRQPGDTAAALYREWA
jgi:cephalosporin-C deacetylase-like acetyl esterase